MLFTSLHQNCWDGPTGAAPNTGALEAIHWAVVTNMTMGYSFQFCISNLRALP
jgi:hypothetical protein